MLTHLALFRPRKHLPGFTLARNNSLFLLNRICRLHEKALTVLKFAGHCHHPTNRNQAPAIIMESINGTQFSKNNITRTPESRLKSVHVSFRNFIVSSPWVSSLLAGPSLGIAAGRLEIRFLHRRGSSPKSNCKNYMMVQCYFLYARRQNLVDPFRFRVLNLGAHNSNKAFRKLCDSPLARGRTQGRLFYRGFSRPYDDTK